MTNEYYELCSNPTKQQVHYNHGWWCTECTNHLFEIDEQTDHTGEWIEVIRQWAEIALFALWDGLLLLGSTVTTMIMGLAWILFCFIEGVESDTRIYEQQLTEKDGLGRKARDELNCRYGQLLKERHYLVKSIDECKSNLAKGAFVAMEKSYKGPEQDFIEHGAKSTLLNPRVDQDAFQLETYCSRLGEVEGQLSKLEKELCIHRGV